MTKHAEDVDLLIRERLSAALSRRDPDGTPLIDLLVESLLLEALAGDRSAVREIFDRVAGRPPPAPARPAEPPGPRHVICSWRQHTPTLPAMEEPAGCGPGSEP